MVGNKKVFQSADDVHIAFEDQQKINRFAKHNARMDDLKIELQMKKNDYKNLEEAVEELELFDEDEDIPFLFGEVFLNHKLPQTQKLLADLKKEIAAEVAAVESKIEILKAEMNELKSHLYQRFGNNISLENND